MHINCQALGCMECCKHYWISLFPSNAAQIAQSQGESLSQFLATHCLLDLQLFPAKRQSGLSIPVSAFDPKTQVKISESFDSKPGFVLALPSVVLKRHENGACEFLNQQNGLCQIYSSRPGQCRVFPFVSMDSKPLHELYPFCAFLENEKPTQNPFQAEQDAQLQATANYFDSVEQRGFESVWKHFPEKGIIRIGSKVIAQISQEEFLHVLSFIRKSEKNSA